MIYIAVLSKRQAQINALRVMKVTGAAPPFSKRVWVTDGEQTVGFERLADVKADPRFRKYHIALLDRHNGIATGRLVSYAEQRERKRYSQMIRDEVESRAEAPFRDWRY